VRLLVADKAAAARTQGSWLQFDIPSVTDHEVIVIG
jgi:hypothetical protein